VHELSLCDDLLSQVNAIALQHDASSVISITVHIGPLSGVEPMLLESAFTLIKEGTVAEHAQLVMQISTVTILCRQCGTQSEVAPNRLICNACNSHETTLVMGDELILASVELNCAN
jgi:hydrogenase nickel incorporation protein HypA/HybF